MAWVKRQTERMVDTPAGQIRLLYNRPVNPITATFVLGHGAGAGPETHDLVALSKGLALHGISVVRVEQPWHVEGKKVAPKPQHLDRGWEAVFNHLRSRKPLIVGGRSAGARVACRTARRVGAIGVVALAFPLHPPGQLANTRSPELLGAGVPTLVIQGERDPFGTPYEFPTSVDMTIVPGAAHDLKVPKRHELSQEEADTMIVEAAAEFITRLVGPAG